MSDPTAEQRVAAEAAVASAMPFTAFDDEREAWARFANNLAQVLALRGAAPGDEPSHFCLVDRPNQFGSLEGATPCFDLDRDASVDIRGRLVLVAENANGGVAFNVAGQEAVVAKLAELSVDDAPMAAYYPQDNILRVYPGGFWAPEVQYTMVLSAPRTALTEEDLKAVIDDFHERCVCTPQLTNGNLWEDQSTWLPKGTAEKVIQWPLKAALVMAFRETALVKEEEVNAAGDTDFILYSMGAPFGSPPQAIVEVKVQKSRRESGEVAPGETRKEFVRGLIQTSAYRNVKKASYAMLACFDLRKPGAGTDAAWDAAHARAKVVFDGLQRAGRGGPPTVVTWMVFANTESAQAAAAVVPLRTEETLYPVRRRPDYYAELVSPISSG
jgi:hypothetical protein